MKAWQSEDEDEVEDEDEDPPAAIELLVDYEMVGNGGMWPWAGYLGSRSSCILRCFRMLQDAPGCSRMLQDSSRVPRISEDALKFLPVLGKISLRLLLGFF